jgi:hypothetical protein
MDATQSLFQGAHHLGALDGRIGGLPRLEAEGRLDQAPQLAETRFDDVVQILDPPVRGLERTSPSRLSSAMAVA